MAAYQELRQAAEDPDLKIQVQVACIVAANKVAVEATDVPLHAERLRWAARAFEDPVATAGMMINAVLAKNAALTLAQILVATDAQVQTHVDNSVNVFAATMG